MIPSEFDYFAPSSVKEAVALLARSADAKVLGGGMSLIPALKHRLTGATALVDLGRIRGLEGIASSGGRIAIGARTTHAALAASAELAGVHAIAETAGAIGDVQVRNRGTLGGSLVHADPAADWPALFLALDGEAQVSGPRGERSIAAAEFFQGMLASAVERDEVLTEVRLAAPPGRSGTAYVKLRQPASGFAIVGVAAWVALDRQGRIERAALGITGVNPVPFRAHSLEARLRGQAPDAAALGPLCARIEEADPLDDLHASSEYRAHLAGVFALRALTAAAARAAA